jgi:hypothetical protein
MVRLRRWPEITCAEEQAESVGAQDTAGTITFVEGVSL